MSEPSKRKQKELLERDSLVATKLYQAVRWPKDELSGRKPRDLTRVWDLRCIWGMKGILPFNTTCFKNLGELLWLTRELIKRGDIQE